jgi:hypothetical protein
LASNVSNQQDYLEKKKIIMRYFPFVITLLSFGLPGAPVAADSAPSVNAQGTPRDMGMLAAQKLSAPPSIYAWPGKSCPVGSELYKGPEEVQLAAESGAVYCSFKVKVVTLSKKDHNACPPGTKSHIEAKAKPDPDTIWCEADPDHPPVIPPMPSMFPRPANSK